MQTGTIKFFIENKGYGFIQPSDGGPDVFVHVKALPPGIRRLIEGQAIQFEIGPGKNGKTKAVKVELAK